jgi:hypothetical protein
VALVAAEHAVVRSDSPALFLSLAFFAYSLYPLSPVWPLMCVVCLIAFDRISHGRSVLVGACTIASQMQDRVSSQFCFPSSVQQLICCCAPWLQGSSVLVHCSDGW